MLFFILLSIISVNHQNMNNFWQNYFFSAYYRLILQNLAESFSRLSKVARKKNIFSTYAYGSQDRAVAIGFLKSFLSHMLCFAEENEALRENIIYDCLNLVLERALPIPHKLHEEVVETINETAGGFQEASTLPYNEQLEIVMRILNTKYESPLLAFV